MAVQHSPGRQPATQAIGLERLNVLGGELVESDAAEGRYDIPVQIPPVPFQSTATDAGFSVVLDPLFQKLCRCPLERLYVFTRIMLTQQFGKTLLGVEFADMHDFGLVLLPTCHGIHAEIDVYGIGVLVLF